jgi:hypothetical protein
MDGEAVVTIHLRIAVTYTDLGQSASVRIQLYWQSVPYERAHLLQP